MTSALHNQPLGHDALGQSLATHCPATQVAVAAQAIPAHGFSTHAPAAQTWLGLHAAPPSAPQLLG